MIHIRTIRIIIVILLLSGRGTAWAGWEEASTAFQQGDYSTALSEYHALAEGGDPKAQNNLGTMYDLGQGAPQNHKEAAKWFRKAALQGLAGAQFNLGWMYWKGQGVVQDYVQAHMWFNIAGANGDEDAIESRDSISRQMTKAQIAEAQKLARDWMALHP
jgi:TPR repeat protein